MKKRLDRLVEFEACLVNSGSVDRDNSKLTIEFYPDPNTSNAGSGQVDMSQEYLRCRHIAEWLHCNMPSKFLDEIKQHLARLGNGIFDEETGVMKV